MWETSLYFVDMASIVSCMESLGIGFGLIRMFSTEFGGMVVLCSVLADIFIGVMAVAVTGMTLYFTTVLESTFVG